MPRSVLFAAVLGVAAAVFSCGGEEFGSGSAEDGEAGTGALGDGGSEIAAGGSSTTPSEGGAAGSATVGGMASDDGGEPPIGGSDGGGSAGSPSCTNGAIAPELPGDCKRVVCSMGELMSEPDDSDAPEPRGPCDVPQCDGGQPKFGSDPSQCQLNQVCSEGNCDCKGCPNGAVPALPDALCRMPASVVASANPTLAGSAASNAVDGSSDARWNSGALNGTLTLDLPTAQPMTAVVVWLTGLAEPSHPQKVIQAQVNLTPASGPAIVKQATFNFAQEATGPLRFELGLVNAKKLTFTFESPSTWIAVNEVIFEICQ